MVLLPILLGIANNGGIGGGGLIIPVCIAFFGFSTIQAIALSSFIIFCGAMVRYFCFSVYQRHPDKDATIVDYNICSVMLPFVMFGSLIGSTISQILPEAIITIILIMLLFYLTYDSFYRAIHLWNQESILFNT